MSFDRQNIENVRVEKRRNHMHPCMESVNKHGFVQYITFQTISINLIYNFCSEYGHIFLLKPV